MNRPSGAAGERELDVLASAGWTVLELESAARRRHLFGARRPLWTRPEGFVLRPVAPDLWRAEFVLPAGSYATALLYALTGVWPERRGD
jgi:tRNA(Glu) U13 pseudouridine synthase TruD